MAAPATARLAIGYIPICATRMPPRAAMRHRGQGMPQSGICALAHRLFSDMRYAHAMGAIFVPGVMKNYISELLINDKKSEKVRRGGGVHRAYYIYY